MTIKTRLAKFRYIFWSYGKERICEIKDNEITIFYDDKIDYKKRVYEFKKFPKIAFLTIKYLPIILLSFITLTKYDFVFTQAKLLSYFFSILLIISFFYLENLARMIAISLILFLSFFVGIFVFDTSLITSYALKYFVFLLCVFGIFIDSRYSCYSVLENGKVVSHFLTKEII